MYGSNEDLPRNPHRPRPLHGHLLQGWLIVSSPSDQSGMETPTVFLFSGHIVCLSIFTHAKKGKLRYVGKRRYRLL
jgi:hypothetical protein